MNLWHDLNSGPKVPRVINVVVEIPKGSRNKYEFDKSIGAFRLDRVLYSAMEYPGDYGLIPRTYYDDGDPLDVLIMMNEPTFSGCIIQARPIGLFRMLDRGKPDDKILAVPVNDPLADGYHDIGDIPPHFLKEVAHFFAVYKDLEGARVKPIGWEKAKRAQERITYAVALYQKRFRKKRKTP
jgi:inorganic pyrophosphatase